MLKVQRSIHRRRRGSVRGLRPAAIGLLLLAACVSPGPLPTLVPTLGPDETAALTPLPGETRPPPATRAPATPTPSPTPAPVTLIVCQTDEPLSLYLYGDDVAARAGIMEALYDGPIDVVGYELRPVILEDLPTVENGGLTLTTITVEPGDRVVDAVTLQVVQVGEGVRLAQADGSVITYTGSAPAPVVQVSAEFRLRPGVLWSDNQQVTAADSRFSFEAAAYYDTPASKFITDRTQSYEAVDTLTARWTGLPGWRDRDAARRFWSPLPRHLFEGVSPSELRQNVDANERPLGWGPFVLQEWRKGEALTLVRNPNYFRAAEGLPRVDRVVFRFGLAPEQILAEVEAGGCHLGSQATDFTGLASQLLERGAAGALAPVFAPDTAFEHLDFGIAPAPDYRRPAGLGVFADARVRQGLAYCVDRQALIDELQAGVGEVPDAYVPPGHPLFAADQVTRYPFDQARGRQLLAEAGWNDADGDGVREKDGDRLVLDYVSGPEDSAYRQRLAGLLQTQLRACGAELRLRWFAVDDRGQGLYAPWPGGPLFGRRFDLAVFPWRAGLEPPCELYLTSAIPDDLNPAGANNPGYSSPAFDAACQRALTRFDLAGRRAAHAEAQAVFTRDLPSLPLFFRFKAGVAHPDVSGYALDATARSDLWNIETLGIR